MGICPGHRGYTPALYEKCHGIFNNHRESGPQFNVSSERRTKDLCLHNQAKFFFCVCVLDYISTEDYNHLDPKTSLFVSITQ